MFNKNIDAQVQASHEKLEVEEPAWAPLRDNYMLTNSRLKDWDKVPVRLFGCWCVKQMLVVMFSLYSFFFHPCRKKLQLKTLEKFLKLAVLMKISLELD